MNKSNLRCSSYAFGNREYCSIDDYAGVEKELFPFYEDFYEALKREGCNQVHHDKDELLEPISSQTARYSLADIPAELFLSRKIHLDRTQYLFLKAHEHEMGEIEKGLIKRYEDNERLCKVMNLSM